MDSVNDLFPLFNQYEFIQVVSLREGVYDAGSMFYDSSCEIRGYSDVESRIPLVRQNIYKSFFHTGEIASSLLLLAMTNYHVPSCTIPVNHHSPLRNIK